MGKRRGPSASGFCDTRPRQNSARRNAAQGNTAKTIRFFRPAYFLPTTVLKDCSALAWIFFSKKEPTANRPCCSSLLPRDEGPSGRSTIQHTRDKQSATNFGRSVRCRFGFRFTQPLALLRLSRIPSAVVVPTARHGVGRRRGSVGATKKSLHFLRFLTQ